MGMYPTAWGEFKRLAIEHYPGANAGFSAKQAASFVPKRFQAKWKPVRVKKTRQIKNLEPRFDSIETEKALGSCFDRKWRLRGLHGEASSDCGRRG
jgi:hypothetical protein